MEGWDPQSVCAANWPRSRKSRRTLERREWLGCWRKSLKTGRRHERDNPRCVGTMRQCELLRILVGSGQLFKSCTSVLRRLRLRCASSPFCLLTVGALVERAELQLGALPMACVAVPCWVPWLRIGDVSGLRIGDVSLPLWLRFSNSKPSEEERQSRPLSPWADRFWEALLRWAEAKDLRASDHSFPGGIAWLEHKFLVVVGSTPWRHCRWHSLRRGGIAAYCARHPQIQFFIWWAQRRHSRAVCDRIPRRCCPGPSSIASGTGGDLGAYTPGGLGSQYVPCGGRATASGRVPPSCFA